MNQHETLLKAIKCYAIAYEKLDDLQKENGGKNIPIGDQKTGSVGEFYALHALRQRSPDTADLIQLSNNPSEKGWDIVDKSNGEEIKYSVKTTSEYSASRSLSKIKRNDWQFLILVYLDKYLKPIYIAQFKESDIFEGDTKDAVLTGKIAPNFVQGNLVDGSKVFNIPKTLL